MQDIRDGSSPISGTVRKKIINLTNKPILSRLIRVPYSANLRTGTFVTHYEENSTNIYSDDNLNRLSGKKTIFRC